MGGSLMVRAALLFRQFARQSHEVRRLFEQRRALAAIHAEQEGICFGCFVGHTRPDFAMALSSKLSHHSWLQLTSISPSMATVTPKRDVASCANTRYSTHCSTLIQSALGALMFWSVAFAVTAGILMARALKESLVAFIGLAVVVGFVEAFFNPALAFTFMALAVLSFVFYVTSKADWKDDFSSMGGKRPPSSNSKDLNLSSRA
jgi:hypothetical protein